MSRLLLLALLLGFPAWAEVMTGPVRVVDADTIDVGAPVNVRLLGIDAAEDAQTCSDAAGAVLPCGAMATRAARDLYEGRIAVCEVRARDRYGRALATCAIDGRDMGAALVSAGLAQLYRDDATYAEEEKAARLLWRGLWAYDMIRPATWRTERRSTRSAQAGEGQVRPVEGGCGIKGNIGTGGFIYHLPGMRDYDRTTIRQDRGERWFCTEAEALSAGWRRAQR